MLAKRKGFVRVALQTGAKLVPVLGFGENDLYDVRQPGPVRLWLQRWVKSLFGFTLPNPQGQGLLWGESHKGRGRGAVSPHTCFLSAYVHAADQGWACYGTNALLLKSQDMCLSWQAVLRCFGNNAGPTKPHASH